MRYVAYVTWQFGTLIKAQGEGSRVNVTCVLLICVNNYGDVGFFAWIDAGKKSSLVAWRVYCRRRNGFLNVGGIAIMARHSATPTTSVVVFTRKRKLTSSSEEIGKRIRTQFCNLMWKLVPSPLAPCCMVLSIKLLLVLLLPFLLVLLNILVDLLIPINHSPFKWISTDELIYCSVISIGNALCSTLPSSLHCIGFGVVAPAHLNLS